MMRMQGMRIHTVSIRAHKHNPQKKEICAACACCTEKVNRKKQAPQLLPRGLLYTTGLIKAFIWVLVIDKAFIGRDVSHETSSKYPDPGYNT